MRLAILTFFILAISFSALAQSNLQEFLNKHPEFEESASFDPTLRGAKWMKPGSNFASLFQKRGGPVQILTWLAIDESSYQLKKPWIKSVDDFVGAGASYLNSTGAEIALSVLVPHPKQITSRELGLIKEFSNLESPQSSAIASESIEIAGYPARLFQAAADSCHILLSLKKGVLISMSTPQCKDKQALIDFAKSLNLSRLETKLDS